MRSLLEVESRDQVAWESRLVAWKGLEFLREKAGPLRKGSEMVGTKLL